MIVPITFIRGSEGRKISFPVRRADPPAAMPTPPEQRTSPEAICRACPMLFTEVCLSPKCGCAGNRKRARPWETLPQCPEQKW